MITSSKAQNSKIETETGPKNGADKKDNSDGEPETPGKVNVYHTLDSEASKKTSE